MLTMTMANAFDLTSISTLGSAGFLLIFAAVNTANLRCAAVTGGRRWLSASGIVACLMALAALIWQTARSTPSKLWVLAAMLGLAVSIEAAYRLSGRKLRLRD
jgi:hypothetical protein